MVVLMGWRGAAGHPVEDVGVGAIEQGLVTLELVVVEPGQIGIGKTAEDQVGFAHAAVPGSEQQPFAAYLGWRRHMLPLAVALARI